MNERVRVILVEDHTLVRAGIRSLIEGLGWIQVVGEAGNGREALTLLDAQQPDVAFVDIAMPEMNGLELTERISKQYPGVRVIILSMYANEAYVIQALRAGASSYLLKDASPAELELAIRAVMRQENYLSPAVSKHVVDDYMRRVASDPDTIDLLTPRQREVLRLIATGMTGREIAQALTISLKTVETHRALLMGRLNIHDIAGLVRYAIREGLVVPA